MGEGHRKVRARLAAKGIRAGKNRVLRLMRESGLLAPVRRGHPRGDRGHGGRIRTDRPDELWGTDAARLWTRVEGWCWFFGAVDHCVTDVVGWHVAKKGDRWAALEPVRQGVRAHMGGFGEAIAAGASVSGTTGARSTGQRRSRPRSSPRPREAQPTGGLMVTPPICPENRDHYTVELIQTSREDLVMCGPLEKAVEVLRRNDSGGCPKRAEDSLGVEGMTIQPVSLRGEGQLRGPGAVTVDAGRAEEGRSAQSSSLTGGRRGGTFQTLKKTEAGPRCPHPIGARDRVAAGSTAYPPLSRGRISVPGRPPPNRAFFMR